MDISSSQLGVSVSVPFSEISGADGLRVYSLRVPIKLCRVLGTKKIHYILFPWRGHSSYTVDTGAPARETGQRQSDREN